MRLLLMLAAALVLLLQVTQIGGERLKIAHNLVGCRIQGRI